jgi:hypothetical protein
VLVDSRCFNFNSRRLDLLVIYDALLGNISDVVGEKIEREPTFGGSSKSSCSMSIRSGINRGVMTLDGNTIDIVNNNEG